MSGITKYLSLATKMTSTGRAGVNRFSTLTSSRVAHAKMRESSLAAAPALQKQPSAGFVGKESGAGPSSTSQALEETPITSLAPEFEIIEDEDSSPLVFNSGEELEFIDLQTSGCDIILGYQDVGQANDKVVLVLHDSPGYSEDFKNLFEPLTTLGYRIIAPNLPGFGISHSNQGLHETEETVAMLQDLLAKLGIENVRAVISEGTGCITAACFAATTDLSMSMITLNPSGFAPILVDKWFGHLKSNPLTAPVVNATEPDGDQSFTKGSILPLISALNSEAAIVYEQIKEFAAVVGSKKMPFLCMTATDDILTTANNAVAFAKSCGVANHNVKFVQEAEPVPVDKAVSSALVFKSGGHRVLDTHSFTVTEYIMWMLDSVEEDLELKLRRQAHVDASKAK